MITTLMVALTSSSMLLEVNSLNQQSQNADGRLCAETLIDARTANDFKSIAHTSCMEYLSHRGDIRRAFLRVENPQCTHRRVGSIARAAGRLHEEAIKDQPDPEALDRYAEAVRNNARGRSRMFSSCFRTMANSMDDRRMIPFVNITFD